MIPNRQGQDRPLISEDGQPVSGRVGLPRSRHFLLRLVRRGPLVPARLQWIDHEPGFAENRLDRGALGIFPVADAAGTEIDPDILLDRLGFRRRGDTGSLPREVLAAFADPARLAPRPIGHWAYAEPISAEEYRYQLARLRWAETAQGNDPGLRPRAAVDPKQMPLPDFAMERKSLEEPKSP